MYLYCCKTSFEQPIFYNNNFLPYLFHKVFENVSITFFEKFLKLFPIFRRFTSKTGKRSKNPCVSRVYGKNGNF